MEKLLAIAMICASSSAGDNFYRLSPDDGVEAARASIVLFAARAVRVPRRKRVHETTIILQSLCSQCGMFGTFENYHGCGMKEEGEAAH